jgi:type IV pilus assembly protein PilA
MMSSICHVAGTNRDSVSAAVSRFFRKKEIQMKRVQQGFTLIELMIVVAIVGILAAIALPAYQDYVVRSKVTEGLARMAEAKTSISEFYSANSTFPSGPASAGFNTGAAGYVASMNCGNGTCNIIRATFRNIRPTDPDGKSVTLSGSVENGQIVWKCKPGTNGAALKYLPASCRN